MRNDPNSSGGSSTFLASDAAIAEVAVLQQDMVARYQLRALGITPQAIDYRLRIGRLHLSDYRGVYAVGVPAITPHSRAWAAVLAGGPGAVLSHGSAAALWGIYRHWAYPIEVTAPSRRKHRNLRAHYSNLPAEDKDRQWGIPVTSAARTVYDMATRLTDKQRKRAIADMRRERWLHLPDLIALLDRHPHAKATKLLRPLVQHPDRNPTRSPLEDKFVTFAKRYGLPEPETNARVLGYEVDIWYPDHRLAIELDGYEYHRDREQFQADRKRDAKLLANGIPTVRVTEDRLDDSPEDEARLLLRILADSSP